MTRQFSKIQIATAIAVLFHSVGLIGILFFKSELIIKATPVNMLLSFALLLWTQEKKNGAFWLFACACIAIGFAAEVIGVNTGILFGNYKYGPVLGVKLASVPLLIGVNWFIIIYCSAVCVYTLLRRIVKPAASAGVTAPPSLKMLAIITDASTLAVLFDWLMEPVAVKLNFWQWQNNEIPLYNYICWIAVSALLVLIFNACNFHRSNKFAIHLLLIQIMFFLVLRSFL